MTIFPPAKPPLSTAEAKTMYRDGDTIAEIYRRARERDQSVTKADVREMVFGRAF